MCDSRYTDLDSDIGREAVVFACSTFSGMSTTDTIHTIALGEVLRLYQIILWGIKLNWFLWFEWHIGLGTRGSRYSLMVDSTIVWLDDDEVDAEVR